MKRAKSDIVLITTTLVHLLFSCVHMFGDNIDSGYQNSAYSYELLLLLNITMITTKVIIFLVPIFSMLNISINTDSYSRLRFQISVYISISCATVVYLMLFENSKLVCISYIIIQIITASAVIYSYTSSILNMDKNNIDKNLNKKDSERLKDIKIEESLNLLKCELKECAKCNKTRDCIFSMQYKKLNNILERILKIDEENRKGLTERLGFDLQKITKGLLELKQIDKNRFYTELSNTLNIIEKFLEREESRIANASINSIDDSLKKLAILDNIESNHYNKLKSIEELK